MSRHFGLYGAGNPLMHGLQRWYACNRPPVEAELLRVYQGAPTLFGTNLNGYTGPVVRDTYWDCSNGGSGATCGVMYAQGGNIPNMDVGTIAISFLRRTSSGASYTINGFLSMNDTGSSGTYFSMLTNSTDGTTIRALIRNAGNTVAYDVTDTTAVNDGKWHRAVLVRRSQTVHELWLDAKMVQSGFNNSISLAAQSYNRIGVCGRLNAGTPASGFDGSVSWAAVWNRALTATEIQSLESISPLAPVPFRTFGVSAFKPSFRVNRVMGNGLYVA